MVPISGLWMNEMRNHVMNQLDNSINELKSPQISIDLDISLHMETQ